jgi:hypothetical protein
MTGAGGSASRHWYASFRTAALHFLRITALLFHLCGTGIFVPVFVPKKIGALGGHAWV